MIGKKEKNRLKAILGDHYSTSVLVELEKDNITTRNGNQHSSDFIRMVMNGKPNKIIESYIYKAAQTAIKTKAKEDAKRKRILQSA